MRIMEWNEDEEKKCHKFRRNIIFNLKNIAFKLCTRHATRREKNVKRGQVGSSWAFFCALTSPSAYTVGFNGVVHLLTFNHITIMSFSALALKRFASRFILQCNTTHMPLITGGCESMCEMKYIFQRNKRRFIIESQLRCSASHNL